LTMGADAWALGTQVAPKAATATVKATERRHVDSMGILSWV